MTTIAVFGHKKPDTDAIVSAIVMTYWLNQQGIDAKSYRLDDINQETKFLIELAKVRLPELLTHLEPDQPAALVDHNESQQSIANLADAHICYLVDHHKLGDLTTAEPAYIRFEPVGSTSTILYHMFMEKSLLISQQMATLMAGAIISDTLNLTGPTTTDSDKQALQAVIHLAGIQDINRFANQLFDAKSNISDLTDDALVTTDYKQFMFSNKKWAIASIETVKPDVVLSRIEGIQQASELIRQRDGLDYMLVIIVDILKQQSWAVGSNDAQNEIIAQAFNTRLNDKLLDLGNLVSRKKQFVPTLEAFYAQ